MRELKTKAILTGEIVGHGDIASVLTPRNGLCFFASGVSNSQERRESEYEREKKLLLEQGKEKRLVYFSSLSVFYTDSRYTQHKREMEQLVKDNFPEYCIVRVGNITWGDNPYTTLNYFRNTINRGEEPDVWDTYRYIVDKDEFLHWMGMIPDFNCEMNVVGKRMKVSQIVDEIKKGNL